ncbi:LOW QUALITY PROTEIN: NACHT, LRR and PYD domains-containing protein 12-like [Sardina pilchardus]|uniref:LOW QUALITY PROTEIN: NACHT, LRR and PYD domains-containing protein 12-like n=1 Tax=Sardina pilchardus TaxID=27697 RepID=UPI002E0F287E
MAKNILDLLFRTLDELEEAQLKRFKSHLSDTEGTMEGFESIPKGSLEHSDATDVASKMKEAYGGEGSVKMTLTILRKMNLNNLADKLEERDAAMSSKQDDAILQVVKEKHKKWMKEKFGKIYECTERGSNRTLLSKVYTELYITEGESEGVNTQHEVRRIETLSKSQKAKKDKIDCNDIFKHSEEDEKIRTVMTTGIAGIGKSVCVQNSILDWAEGKAHQDVDFIFALPFRQLNLKQIKSYTLLELLLDFHRGLDGKVIHPEMLGEFKIMFIFDGLDERKLSLRNVEQDMDDLQDTASVDVLIANLITGNLLPNALIWITSRPAAVQRIPTEYIDRWTEVQGFNDQQKDDYFKKRITNPEEADTAIAHIKRSKTLYIMCHIPVFCWILATVLLKMINLTSTSDYPQTLTEIYIYFLLTETRRKGQKYDKGFERDDKKRLESNKKPILKLSKLAYGELLKGNILFNEDSLRECGINEEDMTLYSGMCSEFFMSELVLDQHKVYCFVHLSIQEFLAALFVFHSFVIRDTEALRQFTSRESEKCQTKEDSTAPSNLSMAEFFRTEIDKSIQKEDGHLDLFLRFLLGISLESNQKLLQGLLPHIERSSDNHKKTAQYIRRILSEDKKVPERCMNLILCLSEIKDNTLHQEIQQYIDYGANLSPTQCSQLAYMLLVSEETLNEFDLAKYKTSSEGRERLLIVLKSCRKARLVGCDLKEDSCKILASALKSNSLLKELDLSSNPLRDSGVRLLSVGLKHTNCKLKTLRLAGCDLQKDSCAVLASVLQSENSLLKELDLSSNPLEDSGVRFLSVGLEHTNCKLEAMRLANCNITHNSCEIVASVLQSTNSLIKLDLGLNDLGDSGVDLLSKGSSPLCNLQTLRLAACKLSEKSCGIVATVLQSPNSLIELDLSHNVLRDSGVQLLSEGLSSPHCKLQTLRLADCKLTDKLCEIAASILQSPNSLLQLNFSNNDLGDSGVQLLSKGLLSSNSMQILWLADCKLTDKSCEIVASVLQSPNTLQQLDLSDNDLRDSGAQLLCKGLSHSNCKIQTLRLSDCLISEKGCGFLASALTSSPSHLKELDLCYNHPGESGLKLLSARLEDPVCELVILKTGTSVSRARPHLLRYACDLTLDPNTAHRNLSLSEGNRKVTRVDEEQPYPEHPERFDSTDYWPQVLCREGLTGRCYWEAEWSGEAAVISVAYKSIKRKGESYDVIMGRNAKSWSLYCSPDSYHVWHNTELTDIPARSSGSRRVGVHLDWPAGTLSFYSVSSHTLTHLHTFHSTFTEPLCPGFLVFGSSVSLCQIT